MSKLGGSDSPSLNFAEAMRSFTDEQLADIEARGGYYTAQLIRLYREAARAQTEQTADGIHPEAWKAYVAAVELTPQQCPCALWARVGNALAGGHHPDCEVMRDIRTTQETT